MTTTPKNKRYKNVCWPDKCKCGEKMEFNPRCTKRVCIKCNTAARFNSHEQKILWEKLTKEDMLLPLNNIDPLLDFGIPILSNLKDLSDKEIEKQEDEIAAVI